MVDKKVKDTISDLHNLQKLIIKNETIANHI